MSTSIPTSLPADTYDAHAILDRMAEVLSQLVATDRVLRMPEIQRITDLSQTRAMAIVRVLEHDHGLSRKGRGRGTHWLASQFWAAYREWDTRGRTNDR